MQNNTIFIEKYLNQDILNILSDYIAIQDLVNLKICSKHFNNNIIFYGNKKLLDRMDWRLISYCYQANVNFLERFKDRLIWSLVIKNQDIPFDCLLCFPNRLNIHIIKKRTVSLEEFNKLASVITWDKDTWKHLYQYSYFITCELILKYGEHLDIKNLLHNTELKEDILTYILKTRKDYVIDVIELQNISFDFLLKYILEMISEKEDIKKIFKKYKHSPIFLQQIVQYLIEKNKYVHWETVSEYIDIKDIERYEKHIDWKIVSKRILDMKFILKYADKLDFKLLTEKNIFNVFQLKKLEKFIEAKENAREIWNCIIINGFLPKNIFDKYFHFAKTPNYLPFKYLDDFKYSRRLYFPNKVEYLAFEDLSRDDILDVLKKYKGEKGMKIFIIILMFTRQFSQEFISEMGKLIDTNYFKTCVNIINGKFTHDIDKDNFIDRLNNSIKQSKNDYSITKTFSIYKVYYFQLKYYKRLCLMPQTYKKTVVNKIDQYESENLLMTNIKDFIKKI